MRSASAGCRVWSEKILTGLVLLLAAGSACAPRRVPPLPAATALPCFAADAPEVVWAWHPDPAERARLDHWCLGVGAPLVITQPPGPGITTRLLVLSWNVHVGAGRVEDVMAILRRRAVDDAAGQTGFILLLQEAFRSGGGVPAPMAPRSAVPGAIRPRRPASDVGVLARTLGLSLAYVPSMRNGAGEREDEREDRGSAILTTETLRDVRAIELPFGRQRRIAVMATVVPRGGAPLRVVSGHFDVARGTRRQAAYLSSYLAAQAAAGPPIVLGADTNATFGRRDRAVRALGEVLPLEPCGEGRTSAWLARVDFMFSTLPAGVPRTCERVDDSHGSDHVPLLLTIDRWG